MVTAAIAGAAIGSKILAWFEHPVETLAHWNDPLFLMGGKTIVGAFLGGTLLVEWTKRRLGIRSRTGDLFAIPIVIGTAVGRIGCLLSGLDDHTYGTPSSLPWAVDFGDGIPRHPTQAYEIVFLLALVPFLALVFPPTASRRRHISSLHFLLLLVEINDRQPETRPAISRPQHDSMGLRIRASLVLARHKAYSGTEVC